MVRHEFLPFLKYAVEHPYFKLFTGIGFIITFIFFTLPSLINLPVLELYTRIFFGLSIILFCAFLFSIYLLSINSVPIFDHRIVFMASYFEYYIKSTTTNLKILNIIFSWFENVEELIRDKILLEDVDFEILIVKRKRKVNDISYLRMREKDEYRDNELINIYNKTLFHMFLFLMDIASKDINKIRNFEIKEYDFVPVLTMYIFDDKKLVYGPYIAKNCDNIPLIELESGHLGVFFKLARNMKTAFKELNFHYDLLSGREFRKNKEYIAHFSYFDGTQNVSIHNLIDINYSKINNFLTRERIDEFHDFLSGRNRKYIDQYSQQLGMDEFEGRFDALMRYIVSQI